MSLQDKAWNIQSAGTQDEAFGRFNLIMNAYGYTGNVYTLMNDHPSIGQKAFHGVATTYPQSWLDHYNAKQYQKDDAVWNRLLSNPSPFFWTDLIKELKSSNRQTEPRVHAAQRVMHEAEEAGVADGIGISFVNLTGEISGIGLSRTRAATDNHHEILAEVFLLSTFFHEKFLSFYDKANLPRLTPREKDVLQWAAENKTDFEIASILNLSSSTVRFHWNNIFRKLGTYGRVAAIVRAMRLGLVMPQTVRRPCQD